MFLKYAIVAWYDQITRTCDLAYWSEELNKVIIETYWDARDHEYKTPLDVEGFLSPTQEVAQKATSCLVTSISSFLEKRNHDLINDPPLDVLKKGTLIQIKRNVDVQPIHLNCSKCNSDGLIGGKECSKCKGSGIMYYNRKNTLNKGEQCTICRLVTRRTKNLTKNRAIYVIRWADLTYRAPADAFMLIRDTLTNKMARKIARNLVKDKNRLAEYFAGRRVDVIWDMPILEQRVSVDD